MIAGGWPLSSSSTLSPVRFKDLACTEISRSLPNPIRKHGQSAKTKEIEGIKHVLSSTPGTDQNAVHIKKYKVLLSEALRPNPS